MKNKLIRFWDDLSKAALMSMIVLLGLFICFFAGTLTVISAVVLGTAAVVFAVLSLRE